MAGRCGSGESGESEERTELSSFEEQYREIALTCFRFLDFKSFAEVDQLTIPEYELLMEAARLKQVDKDYRNHLQAFLNFAVKAEKKSGKKSKPIYSKFKKFYDYEDEQEKARGGSGAVSRFSGIGKLLNKGE